MNSYDSNLDTGNLPESSDRLLSVRELGRSFGGLRALDGVSFDVLSGQIKAVIGPNGAGKTTLFNIISGIIEPHAGSIFFRNSAITGLASHKIGRLGISRTFQNLSLFDNMSVIENVMVGCHCRTGCGMFSSSLRLPAQRREEHEIREKAGRYLEVVGLSDRSEVAVGSLAFGQRRLVELARALATEPKLLLLDEPASGLNMKETMGLGELIGRIRDRGVTVLLVEHDMSIVMDISDSVFVMDYGKPVADGTPRAVRNNPDVISIYLGGELEGAAS